MAPAEAVATGSRESRLLAADRRKWPTRPQPEALLGEKLDMKTGSHALGDMAFRRNERPCRTDSRQTDAVEQKIWSRADRALLLRVVPLAPSSRGKASTYKYQADLGQLSDCPGLCAAASGPAYRLVHEPFHERDFQPSALWKPEYRTRCAGWGLSLYTTEHGARRQREKLRKLASKYPNITKEIGECIASGTLDAAHGVMTSPTRDEHFTLHEYADVGLSSSFVVVVGEQA